MKGYYSDTRPDGRPVPAGTLCWISDYTEEGLGKVATYASTELGITEKLAMQNAHAQMVIAQRQATPPPSANGNAPAPAPPPAPSTRTRLTDADRMKATADLDNPAHAGTAVVRLFEDATGISVQDLQQERFNRMYVAWLDAHPEFPRLRANQRLLLLEASVSAGGQAKITPQVLDAAYQKLLDGGDLLAEMPDDAPENQSTEPSAARPGESQHPPARPRVVASTTHRTTRLASPAAPPFRPKYSREQIDRMSVEETRRLDNDPDYNASIDYWYPGERSRARA